MKSTPQRLCEKEARRLQTAQSNRQSGRFVYDPGGVAHRTSGEELARLGEVQEIVRPIFQHTLEREFDLLLRRVCDGRVYEITGPSSFSLWYLPHNLGRQLMWCDGGVVGKLVALSDGIVGSAMGACCALRVGPFQRR